jgi:hypothetical protein
LERKEMERRKMGGLRENRKGKGIIEEVGMG